MATSTVRIVTINTGKCDGPYRARLDTLVRALAELTPDLILAQEVFEATDHARAGVPASGLSTARRLADGLGMAMAFCPIRRKQRAVEGVPMPSCSGLATLSRWPMREVTWRALPDDPEDGDRGVLLVTIDTPEALVQTANTHLTHLRHRDDLRVEQTLRVLNDGWWAAPSDLRVLAGDLNARPGHAVHDVITSHPERPFHDAFTLAGIETPPPTFRRETDAGAVEARLDFVYLGDERSGRPRVSEARVVLDESVGGVLPSDHFGVLVEVALD